MPPTRRSARSTAPTYPYSRTNDDRSDTASAARGVRSTRNPRKVVEPDSDDDEDMEDDENDMEQELSVEDDMDDDEEEEEDEEMDDEEDAEGEDDDDDDELAANIPPPRPHIQQSTNAQGKPKVHVTAPREGTLKSVEAKEMEDDEELSDLGSDDDGLGDTMGLDDDEDDDDNELDDGDEDDDSEAGSGSATPDPSKLTRRQRANAEDIEGGLMSLSNEAQKKKHISAEEHVMRRAEMARRRKNLSEKRNEEEKIDTINKLLSKPAPKRRSRAEMLAAQTAANAGTPGAEGEDEDVKPDALFARWVNNASGSRIGVPVEWLESPVGEGLAKSGSQTTGGRVLVEEVA